MKTTILFATAALATFASACATTSSAPTSRGSIHEQRRAYQAACANELPRASGAAFDLDLAELAIVGARVSLSECEQLARMILVQNLSRVSSKTLDTTSANELLREKRAYESAFELFAVPELDAAAKQLDAAIGAMGAHRLPLFANMANGPAVR